VRSADALPNDVDHENVDMGTICRPVLLKHLQRGGNVHVSVPFYMDSGKALVDLKP
jgi:hypothetical protein